MPELNAIGIAVSDMARSIQFYRLVGLDVPETPDGGHVCAALTSRGSGRAWTSTSVRVGRVSAT
jgi:hypothetical protein